MSKQPKKKTEEKSGYVIPEEDLKIIDMALWSILPNDYSRKKYSDDKEGPDKQHK